MNHLASPMHSDQQPFGIHAGKDVAKAFAFLANQVGGGHLHIVEEDRRGRMVHHRVDGVDGQRSDRHLADLARRGLVRSRAYTWSAGADTMVGVLEEAAAGSR